MTAEQHVERRPSAPRRQRLAITVASGRRRVRARHARPRVLAPRRAGTALVAMILVMWSSATAFAQLDPLLFLKRVPPTVIVVVDTSLRMLEDGNGNFYDPGFYLTSDAAAMPAFPAINPATTKTYRRVLKNLTNEVVPGKYKADVINAVAALWDPAQPLTSNSPGDIAFLNPTRYVIAKQGIAAAVTENKGSTFRWGLIRTRQSSPAWRVSPNCDKPLTVLDATQLLYRDANPCDAGGIGKYGVYAPSVAAANYSLSSAPAGTVMVTPASNTSAAVLGILNKVVGDNAGLVPAGIGGVGYVDRPITYMLDDARAAAAAAMTADSAANRACRNTVVVLVTGGKDAGDATYTSTHNPATTASTFMSVTASGVTKRVPIFVVSVKPAAADEAQLQSIATNSGGMYRKVSSASEVTAAINLAVQMGFTRSADFDSGKSSEFLPVTPIVGTVNMKDARDASGVALPNTDINASPGGQHLPQRSNTMITAGFGLPGFDGRLRAFRTYKPVADATKPTGWKFVNDGTRLWPDLDGRPQYAGMARTPADPNNRNIYTFIPDGSGGGSVVAFTAANVGTLSAHLGGVSNPAALINAVRAQPLGAIIGSTPALMDPPSLDPPPDDDYGRTDAPGTFAGDHKDRRSIIFVGANDGMLHAIDARTGYEVWAFIPYNLLPKLRTLADGQPVEQFDYFVDSSPKIAEVKISGHWRSLVLIGEGPGGVFYQAFDVTEAGMGVSPDAGDFGTVTSLLTQFDTPNESIQFKWAFPNYSSFDPNYTQTFTVTDGTPGGRVKLFGDLKATATYAEKTVGFTWSDPAVGPLNQDRSTNAVIVGSGYFPDIEASIPNRGASAPKAGNVLYLVDANTGALIGNASQTACSGNGCLSVGDVSNARKNALQADPTAAGDSGSFIVNKAYLGDIDGKYWRFNFGESGSITNSVMVDTGSVIYASSALLFVGSADVYMFFSTGSDILPVTAPGGTGTFRLYGLKDNTPGSGATTKFAHDLSTVTNSGGIANGERPSTSPSVAGDIVFYTTTAESSGAPCSDFTGNLYALTYLGGAAYDANANGKIDNNENPIAKSVSGRATSPFIVDQHLYFGTAGANGANVEAFGDPQDFNNGIGQVGVRILSWREIR